jgi:hypothetical protein
LIERQAAARVCEEKITRILPNELTGWVRFFRTRDNDADGPDAGEILRLKQTAQHPADLLKLGQHLACGAHIAIGVDVKRTNIQLRPAIMRMRNEANREQQATSAQGDWCPLCAFTGEEER